MFQPFNLNKSLLGIETLEGFEFWAEDLAFNLNKSLLGIETPHDWKNAAAHFGFQLK